MNRFRKHYIEANIHLSESAFSVGFGTGPDNTLAGVTPEPASMLLFGTGLLGIGFVMRKRILS